MAPLGENEVKSFQYLAERFGRNDPAGGKFEIVPIDNKPSPAETVDALNNQVRTARAPGVTRDMVRTLLRRRGLLASAADGAPAEAAPRRRRRARPHPPGFAGARLTPV